MADISDVAEALVQVAASAVYPEGTAQQSIGGCDIIVYQGWPNPQTLDANMAAGKAHISVFPRPGDTITTTMAGDADWIEQTNNGTIGTAAREVRRQTKQFQITVWAPTPQLRDTIAKELDLALALTSRMDMGDGSQAILTYVNQTQHDEQQKVLIYRRDFFYAANYATVQTSAEYAIKHTVTDVTTGPTITAVGTPITVTSPSA